MNKNERTKALIASLMNIRKDKGYSQEYMSMAMGISRAKYGHIETGRCNFTVDQLVSACEVLEVEVKISIPEKRL